MGTVCEIKWEKPGFVQNLPQILLPRVLAEGYYIRHEDQGKQVFRRGEVRGKILGTYSNDEILRAFELTVSYVLTPQITSVRFTFEHPLSKRPLSISTCEWLRTQSEGFLQYLNDWWEAQSAIASKQDIASQT